MDICYIVIPKVDKVKEILKKLYKLGIQKENIHLSIENKNHSEMAQILDISIFETTDLVNSLVRGTILGGLAALLIGLFTKKEWAGYYLSENNILCLLTIFGMVFGAWASSLIGISMPNPAIEKFESALDRGAFVLRIKITGKEKKNFLQTFKLQYPEAILQTG